MRHKSRTHAGEGEGEGGGGREIIIMPNTIKTPTHKPTFASHANAQSRFMPTTVDADFVLLLLLLLLQARFATHASVLSPRLPAHSHHHCPLEHKLAVDHPRPDTWNHHMHVAPSPPAKKPAEPIQS